ncbi:hypothetical protein BT96DRAFT_915907, partial [Gymnopus androsaceus JB14]
MRFSYLSTAAAFGLFSTLSTVSAVPVNHGVISPSSPDAANANAKNAQLSAQLHSQSNAKLPPADVGKSPSAKTGQLLSPTSAIGTDIIVTFWKAGQYHELQEHLQENLHGGAAHPAVPIPCGTREGDIKQKIITFLHKAIPASNTHPSGQRIILEGPPNYPPRWEGTCLLSGDISMFDVAVDNGGKGGRCATQKKSGSESGSE